jgi:uncharacterized membrane protein
MAGTESPTYLFFFTGVIAEVAVVVVVFTLSKLPDCLFNDQNNNS